MNNEEKKQKNRNRILLWASSALCVAAIGAGALITADDTSFEIEEEAVMSAAGEADKNTAAVSEIINAKKSDADNKTAVQSKPQKAQRIRQVQSDKNADKSSPYEGEATFSRPLEGERIAEFSPDELIYSVTLDDWRTHNGADYKSSLGEAVRSIADGRVRAVLNDDMLGCGVAVEHSGGYMSFYYNLSPEISVSEGQTIKKGDTIGGVGESAWSEGAQEPHLHLEVTKSGERIDPESLFLQ